MSKSWEIWTPGTGLARWNVSELQAELFPGTARPMPDTVDYRFVNGWVDTGDLPCREALRAAIQTRTVTLPQDLSFPAVYLGGAAGDVDFSDFCHVPQWRVRHARVQLQSEQAQSVRLSVMTAGAVHIWCDDVLVHRFEPFTRNTRQTSCFDMALAAGEQTLTLRFEDLHERDTIFGFRLSLLKGEGLKAGIDYNGTAAELDNAVALLEGLRTTEVFHRTKQVRITSDALPEVPLHVSCLDHAGQGGALSKTRPNFDMTVSSGCPVLRFAVKLGNLTLLRKLGMTVMPDPVWLRAADFEARQDLLLARQESGDDIVNTLLALSKNSWDDLAESCLIDALERVEARYDCADFRMMSLVWIWDRYRDQLSSELRDRLQSALLGFRYWMDEPGNDVMWFWSENHVLCFHIAQHLAGQMMRDAVFTNSGQRGAEQEALGAARLHKWFDAIDAHGLAEWNSAAYYPINYRGLLALFTLTQDVSLKQRAKTLLDRISQMVALHICGGVAAGSQGRIYEKELLAGPMTELGAVASLMFGGWHVPGKDAVAVMMALSDYRPDQGLDRVAYPERGQHVRARYQQGLDGSARLSLFKTAAVQLSCVEHHMPGSAGHQQHVVDLQFAATPLARLWINHPGTLRHWAEDRPSFWAGNGRLPDVVQADGAVAMLYELQEGDIPFSHLFLPQNELDEVLFDSHWRFVRAGTGFAAIWSFNPLTSWAEGLYAQNELRQAGPVCAWGIQVSDAGSEDFARFVARMRSNAPELSDEALTVGAAHLVRSQSRLDLAPLPNEPRIEFKTAPVRDRAL